MQPFVAALGTELGLTSKDIADIIWLALQMQNSDAGAELATALEVSPPEMEGEARSRPASPDFVLPVKPEKKPELEAQPKSAELHQPNTNQPSFGRQLALKVPDARSLREPLSLARSLKPLLRRVVSGWSTTLDEVATVERIADEQLWLPVLKPALEPWLDLALVVDESISMQIWHRTIAELQRLLSHYGVFRDVRVWRLVTDERGQVKLQPGIGTTARRQTARRPSELIDPSGRRLILVATDCVSSGWRDGTLVPALKLWASSGPLAIVQMLPEWLWSRTGLGFASAIKLQSLLPGVPNQQLIASEVSHWDEVDLDAGIKVPVVTLEPEPFATWTEMVAGKGGVWSPGFVLEEAVSPNGQIPQLSAITTEGSAEQRVQRFRVTASPMARRLAGLLAAAPVISLPVVRIIQDQLLPESRQVHVAEVFLGGLLKPLGKVGTGTNPDAVQYDFLHGVREVLLEAVPTSDSVTVLEAVSRFVAERLGLSLDAFAAVLRNPQQIEDRELANQSRPFAMVTAQILRQLGGQYAQFSEELEQQYVEPQQTLAGILNENSNEAEGLYEVNLFIVGEGGVGKTTLAQRILESNYQEDKASTQGINISQWYFTLDNGKEMRVNIWEFGGQEIYHATHQFFLTKRSLYLLVVDTRREDTDFYYWLNIIELLSDSSPVLIIKNEKQDRKLKLNERSLRSEFANLQEILATNLATNRGLPEILTKIQYYIQRLPHIGTKLPKAWFRVRETLEREVCDYITLNEYFKICQNNGLMRRGDALQLSGYLHDLGICFHFQGDPLLNKILILNPNWITDAIYKVLDSPQVIRNLGKFDRSDLEVIWHEDKYTAMRPELLRLMISFKLCYEIPNRSGNYIAPQLLSLEQPEYSWEESENLLLRYEYEFMPKGILTRFIVEMYPWIEQQAYVWKTGVILNKDDARAEVIELYRYHKGEIRIRVSGNRKRNLLTTIRHELDKIHSTYERLQYNTLIPCNCSNCKRSLSPHFYPLQVLQRFLDNYRKQIECTNSYEMVNIRSLIGETEEYLFDVFFSYNTKDAPIVTQIAEQLQARGIRPWLDIWNLRPGQDWQTQIKEQMSEIRSAAIFISSDSFDLWQSADINALLKEFVSNDCPIIPVLLDVPHRQLDLPIFLQNLVWVDFSQQNSDSIEALIQAISGHKADNSIESSPTATSVEDDLSSEKMLDYRILRDLLKAARWKEADQETYRMMIQAVGKKEGDWFNASELVSFSNVDLGTINSLWVKYSNGRFGFSVQKQIWQECGSPTKYSDAWERFGDFVGWRVNAQWITLYEDIQFSFVAPRGHLPSWFFPVSPISEGGFETLSYFLSRPDL